MALEGMPHTDMAVAITLGRYPTHHNSVRHSNIIPSTVTCCLFHKGPYIKDVRKIFGFFDPLPPLSAF